VLRFATRQAVRLLPLLALIVTFGLIAAQAKPNLSGTWKANVTKSDFGPMPAPDSDTRKIDHQDPKLKVNVATSGGMGDLNYEANYTTDGQESTNHVMDSDFKSVAKWDGDDLVIDTKGSFNGTDFTAKDRWSLSEDGKTLTVQRHLSSAMGEADQKVVYDKQ
jgi:hypothetical protein